MGRGEPEARVLVVGPRRGLCEALTRRCIPYVVWSGSANRFQSAEHVHRAPVDVGRTRARHEAEFLAAHGPFTHVVAGTEGAVVPAAVARRVLGARTSAQTTVIRCHDKLRMKQHLVERGIRMTPFLSPDLAGPPEAIVERLGVPVVIKPRTLSGGRQIEVVHDATTLARRRLRGRILEGWIEAPEISVESFINGGRILFESVTEYARKTHVNIVPAGLDEATRAAVRALNRRVIDALNIHWGMTHLEIYLTREGPCFGEIALRPPGGYIMDLLALAWGFDPWQAFVAVEVDRSFRFPGAPCAHAAALILHPGPGKVSGVSGLADVKRMAEVVEARLKVGPGDEVRRREGIAQNVGHVVLRATSRQALLAAWANVEARLRIDLHASPLS